VGSSQSLQLRVKDLLELNFIVCVGSVFAVEGSQI
jgi:hypothetical protein